MEAFSGQMGCFPSSKDPTGQRRDSQRLGGVMAALDMQLLLGFEVWLPGDLRLNTNKRRSDGKCTRQQSKFKACEQRQHNADAENLSINPQEPVLKRTHLNSPRHCRGCQRQRNITQKPLEPPRPHSMC